MKTIQKYWRPWPLYLLLSLGFNLAVVAESRTALDDYVAKPDPHYQFQLWHTAKTNGYTTFILEMTSQMWLTTNEVNRPLWKHWLVLVKPDTVTHPQSLLFISGGSNDKPPPAAASDNLVQIARATESVVAELRMVPNQPLIFAGETQPRSEDSLIAYTWDKFLRTGDPKWPARLPMTKSAVRAMDTITTFCASAAGGGLTVNQFMVAGGSKRGWTTWTTAAVDKRVIAIAPIVIDMLNIEPSFLHHYAAYGFWAPAIQDYTEFHIMDWNGTPQYRALMKIEEPYQYRQRLTMPKFIINASGDQFFLPDSAQFYFKDLRGVKYLRYVPNADHSLKGSDAWLTLLACYQAILNGAPLPQFSWQMTKNGLVRIKTTTPPKEVKLWQATNLEARDFRLETLGPAWHSTPITSQSDGQYQTQISKPSKGWTAYFVELTFPGPGATPYKFTTEVRVIPDTVRYHFQPKPIL